LTLSTIALDEVGNHVAPDRFGEVVEFTRDFLIGIGTKA
jgi:hypothetical protein